ncbi:hypothetical protein NCCP1664_11910 [Zafaria cholistanensis]|uniref:Uncharacterized protein n=1 Tax=Zafaria cholistanensis TaxID=1682741 RepID=A0A5A7NP59_9MICC|nr:hypothetical protein NCCP1664_11910 [Zafaria cholistanensis]
MGVRGGVNEHHVRHAAHPLERLVREFVLAGAEVPLDYRSAALAQGMKDPLHGVPGRRKPLLVGFEAKRGRANGTVLPRITFPTYHSCTYPPQ